MRIRFTIDITRSDNQSPAWQWTTLIPMLVDMFILKEPETPENVTCTIDGHMFGGGLHCARCGARNVHAS